MTECAAAIHQQVCDLEALEDAVGRPRDTENDDLFLLKIRALIVISSPITTPNIKWAGVRNENMVGVPGWVFEEYLFFFLHFCICSRIEGGPVNLTDILILYRINWPTHCCS